jgi:hypothetical protein
LTAEDVFTGASIGADGTIYVGSEDNNLYALNPDGSQRWSFTTGGVVCTCPAIGADGTIYVGSEDHNLYAITGLYTLTIPFPEPIDPTAPFPLPCSGSSITDPGYGTFTYGPGTVVDLIAEAEEGCYFAEWIGDVGTIDNVYAAETTITMDGNYIVAAHFEELPAPSPFPAPGGCFIATAAYGTPIAEEVEILREFRDEYLLTNSVGQALVDFYYKVSPPMADFIAEHPGLKPIVRAGLVPAVAMATLAVNTTRVEKAAIVGLVALLPAATAVLMARRRNRGREYT